MSLPFSQAADRNKEAIGDALQRWLSNATTVFEFGSGTGQHAVYLCQRYPHLSWQPSDLAQHLDAIDQHTNGLNNILTPVECNVLDQALTDGKHAAEGRDPVVGNSTPDFNPGKFSFAYSANTAHIMSIDAVAKMIFCASALLQPAGCFALYGPFRYGEKPMTDGNTQFDAMLRQQDAAMGVRDKFELDRLAAESGMTSIDDLPMPSNNRILIWQKAG